MINVLFGQVRPTFPSFVAALGGVALAYLWLKVSWIAAAGAAVSLLAIGGAAYGVGDALLNRAVPKAVSGRRCLEGALMAPLALASLVGAGIIVLGVATVPGKDWSEQQKQLTAATATAISAYLTTVFIKGADEADDGWTGAIVKDRFEKRLGKRFPAGAAQDAVFDLTRGWDAATRKDRAREIDKYIGDGGTVLPKS